MSPDIEVECAWALRRVRSWQAWVLVRRVRKGKRTLNSVDRIPWGPGSVSRASKSIGHNHNTLCGKRGYLTDPGIEMQVRVGVLVSEV